MPTTTGRGRGKSVVNSSSSSRPNVDEKVMEELKRRMGEKLNKGVGPGKRIFKTKRAKRKHHELFDSDSEDEEFQGSMRIKEVKVKRKNAKKHNNHGLIPSHPFRTIFTGATGSGKTTLMVNLLTRKRFLKNFFDEIYLFSPNVEVEEEFKLISKLNKRTMVHTRETFDIEEVSQLFSNIVQRAKTMGDDRANLPRILLFIDDFASDRRVMDSKILKTIFFMSRKYSVSTWISTQYYRRVAPEIRTNAEFHVIFVQPNTETEKIAEEMSVGKFTKDKIMQLMNMVADEAFSFLFVNRKKNPNEGRFNFTFENMIKL